MKTMNSNRCSRAATLLVIVVLAVGMTVPAAAVTTSATDVPDSAEVDEDLSVEFELDDLYEESTAWTLNVTTELEGADWVFRTYDNTGDQVGSTEEQAGNQTSFRIDADEGIHTVEVGLSGSVPDVENHTYEPEERVTIASFVQETDGGSTNEIDEWTVHHYTQESADARTAIEEAEAAVADADEAGADTSDAENTLSNAIEAYNGANFGLAENHANDAVDEAEDAKASTEQRQLLTYGAIAIVVLLLLGGGGYVLYNRNQGDTDPLG